MNILYIEALAFAAPFRFPVRPKSQSLLQNVKDLRGELDMVPCCVFIVVSTRRGDKLHTGDAIGVVGPIPANV